MYEHPTYSSRLSLVLQNDSETNKKSQSNSRMLVTLCCDVLATKIYKAQHPQLVHLPLFPQVSSCLLLDRVCMAPMGLKWFSMGINNSKLYVWHRVHKPRPSMIRNSLYICTGKQKPKIQTCMNILHIQAGFPWSCKMTLKPTRNHKAIQECWSPCVVMSWLQRSTKPNTLSLCTFHCFRRRRLVSSWTGCVWHQCV